LSKVTIFHQACKGIDDCGICIFVCPKQLFIKSKELNESGYLPPEIKDASECSGCMNCMIFCPDFAIMVEKVNSGHSGKTGDADE
jgi:2-oxoglutarate ferredoxin oxidoreductase subunit delta